MEKKTLNLLILEDNPDDAELAVKELEREGFVVEWTMVDTEKGFREALAGKPDLILADYSLPSFDGMAALQMRQQLAPEIPLIIVSGTIGEEVAVESMKSGATDYVLKDNLSRLGPVVKRAFEETEAYRERKQAEEALRESETRFRELVNLLPQIVFEMDERGNLTFVNSNAFDIFGFTQDDFDKGLTALQMLRPEDRNRGKENIGRVKKGEKPDSAEYMAQRKDGRTFPVIIYSSPIINENKPVGLRGIIVDITKRKQTEEALKHRLLALSQPVGEIGELKLTDVIDIDVLQELQDSFAESYDIAALIFDDKGKPITEPSNFSDFFKIIRSTQKGMKRCEISDSNLYQLVADGLSAVTNCRNFEEIQDGAVPVFLGDKHIATWGIGQKATTELPEGKVHSYAKEIGVDADQLVAAAKKLKTGSKEQLEQAVSFLKVITNNISLLGLQNIQQAYEITERMLAEEAVRESEEKYRKIFEFSPEAIVLLDREGNLIDVNGRLYEWLGYSPEEAIGKNLLDLPFFPKESKEKVKEMFFHKMGDETSSYEISFVTKSGEKRTGWVVHTPVRSEEGKMVYDLVMISDTTETKRLEAQLQQAQKMEAVGTLAGGIAHDFNNILAAIIGYTELAMIDVPEESHSKQNLKEVLKASHRARDLVKQILTFTRQSKQERRPVLISPIVKEALKLLRSSLPTTIEIHQNIEVPSGWEIVEADPTQIHQVLMNLCTNAHHAMQENGGVLEVSLTAVDLDYSFTAQDPDMDPGQYLKLTVRDTGHGMPPDVLGRVFDPYFTTKEKDKGTGLGLAVVHGIVKDYGGTITVDTELGKGTTFSVYLPKIEGEVITKPEPGPGGIPTGHERILFVDDEQALVEMGEQMLDHLGYEVTTRTSSIEALELFRTKADQFDLVITDMTMPNMTGDQLAMKIMKIRPDLPIILCTGFSERITPEKAKNMGIKAFSMKPLVMRDLADTVRKVLDT
jgi:PAS domain S-box-containing protein